MSLLSSNSPALANAFECNTGQHQHATKNIQSSSQPRVLEQKQHASVSRGASRETMPSSATSTTISSLASFKDGDSATALYAFFRTTVQPMVLLITFSVAVAFGMVAWEDYGATNLWPSRHMIVETTTTSTTTAMENSDSKRSFPSRIESALHTFGTRSIHGLAFGKSERLKLLQGQEKVSLSTAELLPEIRSYNEVMQEHNHERVTRWQDASVAREGKNNEVASMESAVRDLQMVLDKVLELQVSIADYQWVQVHSFIQSIILPKLEPAATILRVQLSDNTLGYNIGYEEIGFDWGSCAWRHCGALADAQEALDELDHLLGVLEPPECLFCLDVVERSIRDMLALVPPEYNALEGIPAYKPYRSSHPAAQIGDQGLGDDETVMLDEEYIKMLQELRSEE
jgi:hypothetical protein